MLKTLDAEIVELIPEEDLENEIIRADEYKEEIYEVVGAITNRLVAATTPASAAPTTTAAAAAPLAAAAATLPTTTTATLPTTTAAALLPATAATLPTTAVPILPTTAAATPPVTTTPPTTTTVGTTYIGPHSSDRVKLPKISLPHFKGNLMRWTPFWDSFNSAVHQNPHLSRIDKFNYLRSLLEGTAYDAVAGLALSDANYEEAIEILRRRFGNKQLIIAKHMDSLLNASAITSDHHLRDLRHLYDLSESNVRSLRTLGVEPDSYGAMLTSVLLSKLPPELRLIVNRQTPSDELDLTNLLELFEKELTVRERANSQPTRRSHSSTSTPAMVATVSGSIPMCVYCQQNHSPTDCVKVSDVESRKRALRNNGRCFNCLRKNHLSRNCRSSSKCATCQGRHHASICDRRSQVRNVPSIASSSDLNPTAHSFAPATTTTTTSTAVCSSGNAVLLQTARTIIYNPTSPKQVLEVRLLLDTGSQRSYLTERAMKLLHLIPSGSQVLSIAAFGANREQTKVCPIVSVGVCLKGYADTSLSLYVVPMICKPLSCQPITASIETNKRLASLDLADSAEGESPLPVDVLIGCDYYWELVTGQISRGKGGPTAIQTKLGWVLCGPAPFLSSLVHSCVATTHLLRVDSQPFESEQLVEQLRSFLELESLGIHEEERTLYDEFSDSVTFQEGRYTVLLPWKEFHKPLTDNYQLCVKRLNGLLKRLRSNPEILKQYDATIREQLKNEIIEPVSPEEKTTSAVHYLPHHGVVRADKTTTKLRIVYDASAKTSGPSLNECLYKGPKFHQLVFDILIRFRAYKCALIADVEKAFLMISVDEKDRDVLRFIWVDDVTKEKPELRTFRFARVVFGVSASPFLLNATVRHHLERFQRIDQSDSPSFAWSVCRLSATMANSERSNTSESLNGFQITPNTLTSLSGIPESGLPSAVSILDCTVELLERNFLRLNPP